MGKRGESFPRRKNDAYDTPLHAVEPLLRHLPASTKFIEPCAGKGDLARHLCSAGHVPVRLFDVKPRGSRLHEGDKFPNPQITKQNALTYRVSEDKHLPRHVPRPAMFITNPPWTRQLLFPIILQLWWQLPTWMLLDADLMHNENFSPYEPMCRDIVSVGRVRWMEGSDEDKGMAPYDNAAWYLFDAQGSGPRLHGRR